MGKIIDLIDKREGLTGQMRDLVNRAEGESRDFNQDEQAQYDAMMDDFRSLTERIKRQEFIDKQDAAKAEEIEAKGHAKSDTVTYRDALKSYMQKGEGGLTPEERSILESRGTATQVTATESLGGYLVPEDFSNEVMSTLKYYGGMLEAGRLYETANGAPLPWPSFDGTGTNGTTVAENASVAVSDMTLGSNTLNAWEINSGIVKASRRLIMDAFFNPEQFINDELMVRVMRAWNAKLTNGSGSSDVRGITTDLTPAELAAITRGGLIDLKVSVNKAYRRNAKWMFNSNTAGAIMKLSIGSNDDRPLWQSSMREGEPDRLEGHPVIINDDLPDFNTSGDNAILFGDFSRYVIRKVKGENILRSDQRYFEERAIGYQAYIHSDGRLLDTSAVKSIGGNA